MIYLRTAEDDQPVWAKLSREFTWIKKKKKIFEIIKFISIEWQITLEIGRI